MNIVHIKVSVCHQEDPDSAAVPVAVPDLDDARILANRLHAEGREYSGIAWGWPVQYDPELHEDAAEFQIPIF